jgi:Phage tail tube protein FII
MNGSIPEKLIAFQVYNADGVIVGVADVELPGIEFLTETLSGAGIAGEIDSPVIGHTKSMSAKIKFRTKTRQAVALLAPKRHLLDLRASIQSRSVGDEGGLTNTPERVVLRGVSKKSALGKFETGKPQDADLEFEVDYLKVVLNGATVLEIDKESMVFAVDGTDYLQAVRSDLGMEG